MKCYHLILFYYSFMINFVLLSKCILVFLFLWLSKCNNFIFKSKWTFLSNLKILPLYGPEIIYSKEGDWLRDNSKTLHLWPWLLQDKGIMRVFPRRLDEITENLEVADMQRSTFHKHDYVFLHWHSVAKTNPHLIM